MHRSHLTNRSTSFCLAAAFLALMVAAWGAGADGEGRRRFADFSPGAEGN